MKKILSFVLVTAMLLTSVTTFSLTTGATSHTRSDAVTWAYSKVGSSLDYDGAYGAQCVDLIAFYLAYLDAASIIGGNAIDYVGKTSLPAGWANISYLEGFVPQPGDIAVWKASHSCSTCNTGSLGHVGIVTSGDSSKFYAVNQNFNNNAYCTENEFNTNCLACVIRPGFTIHTHSYGVWQTVSEATCTVAGSRKRVCSCGDTQTETIAALGHAWDAGEILVNAGCTEDGVKQYSCTRCDAIRTEALSATGHSPVADVEVPATCTETGLTAGSHCAVCNAIITAQQVVPALGHQNHIQSIDRGCDSVSVIYQCDRCETVSNETSTDYVFSQWSEDYPVDVDESLIETKTQYVYRDKSMTYQDGKSSLDGWTYTGNSETIYGSWNNVGWTKTKPTESVTLRITDTKTVTDQAEYTLYNYYHYYGYADDGKIWNSYGNGVWKNYESASSTTSFPEENVYGGHQAYVKSVDGKHGVLWWMDSVNDVPAVTHTEWYYQTRTKTTRYYFEKWSDWSDWSDTIYEAGENREVQTRTVYRYKITPTGHDWQEECKYDNVAHWQVCTVCGAQSDMSVHVYDSEQDEACNICGYVRTIAADPQVDPDVANLTVEDKTVRAGEEFTVTVSLKNNPGIAGLVLSLSYDSDVLTLVKKQDGKLFSGFADGKQMVWDNDENVTDDGVLITLIFRAADDAVAGEYPVSVTVRECLNEEYDDVTLASVAGNVTVVDFVYGDANGDGAVNMKDVLLLRKYIANYDYETETSSVEIDLGADANADGKVNMKDVLLLRKYIANYDYETGTSTVVLGK